MHRHERIKRIDHSGFEAEVGFECRLTRFKQCGQSFELARLQQGLEAAHVLVGALRSGRLRSSCRLRHALALHFGRPTCSRRRLLIHESGRYRNLRAVRAGTSILAGNGQIRAFAFDSIPIRANNDPVSSQRLRSHEQDGYSCDEDVHAPDYKPRSRQVQYSPKSIAVLHFVSRLMLVQTKPSATCLAMVHESVVIAATFMPSLAENVVAVASSLVSFRLIQRPHEWKLTLDR